MPQIEQFLAFELYGNTAMQLATAAGVFLVIWIALYIIRNHVIAHLVKLSEKTHSKIDDTIAGFLSSIRPPVYIVISFFFAQKGLMVPDSFRLIIDIIVLIVIVSQVIRLVEDLTCMGLEAQVTRGDEEAEMPGIFRVGVRMVLWSIGFLLILSNAGVDITSLVAGLGIGGLAISLALQNILSDLFASFSIAVDKPFEIGDFVVVGEHKGNVKHIGLKTTRITALEGEEIVISNAELTSARVQNYKKMEKRRIIFTFGCTYDADPAKLEQIAKDVGAIIEDHEYAELDRIHFNAFGDSDLQFEAVYYMTTSDYLIYMDTQQDINVRILQYYKENGLEMAYPTQTLYVKKDEE